MQLDMKAVTSVEDYAIFDPESVPHLLPGTVDLIDARAEDIRKGNILCYSGVYDGEERLRVYLEEDVSAEFKQTATEVAKDCLLRVPSGRLVFSGMEDLWSHREANTSPEDYLPAGGQECRIPPGDYLIDAYCPNNLDELELELEAVKSPAERHLIDKVLGPLAGILIVSTVFGLPVTLVIAGQATGWGAVWTILAYALIVHAAFWPLFTVCYRLSGASSAQKHAKEERVRRQFPGLVLVMRRLPSGADVGGYSGGWFGPGRADAADQSAN